MFDKEMVDETDDNILQEIIKMCEQHMGGGLKKPDPMEAAEPESPIEEASETHAKPDMEGADLEELMEMYKNIKG